MRTPAQMAEDVNNLNCHAGDGGYGPVTVAQMEAIYAEARKPLLDAIGSAYTQLQRYANCRDPLFNAMGILSDAQLEARKELSK